MIATQKAQQIARVRHMPLDQLRREYFDRDIPVIVEGYTDSWPAAGKWTPQYLADTVGDSVVPVATMTKGDYVNSAVAEQPLREYLEQIGAIGDKGSVEAASKRDQIHYVGQARLDTYLPELLEDIEAPDFFPDEKLNVATMYAGGTLFSQLHYHAGGSALLCMFFGTKHVRLFAPDQSTSLYPYPFHAGSSNASRTVSKEPDPAEFPLFADAEYSEATLVEGDTLFIPIHWWHSIDNEGFSVSATMFWKARWVASFLPPAGLRAAYFFRPVRAAQRVLTKKVRGLASARG